MPTNAIRTNGDIQTNQVISIETDDNNHPMSLAGMSIEVEILFDISATNSVVERKQDMSDKVSEAKSELLLDQLRLDVTGIIILMVGRMWDGNMIHCSAKATVAHNFLRLKDLDGIKPSDNKYLIDVAGYVTNVGRTNHLKSGLRNLDFHLANHRQSIRVTLWSDLRDVLIKKKTKQTGVCPVIVTSTCPKMYNSKRK
ncbi:reverse transcriptase domain-containing protein [Tanacetum coccineum]